MDKPIILYVLTTIVAIYGALLSTINFYKDLTYKRRRIKILISNYIRDESNSELGIITFRIYNIGHIPVTVDPPFLILPNGKELHIAIFSNYSFPQTIEAGRSIILHYSLNNSKEDLAKYSGEKKFKIRCKVFEHSGHYFKSKNSLTFLRSQISRQS